MIYSLRSRWDKGTPSSDVVLLSLARRVVANMSLSSGAVANGSVNWVAVVVLVVLVAWVDAIVYVV